MPRRLVVFDSKQDRVSEIASNFPAHLDVQNIFIYVHRNGGVSFNLRSDDYLVIHIGLRDDDKEPYRKDFKIFLSMAKVEGIFRLPENKENVQVYGFSEGSVEQSVVETFVSDMSGLGFDLENITVCNEQLPPCSTLKYLPALAILCQGYLAAHENKELPLGNELIENFESTSTGKNQQVERTEWWKSGLNNSEEAITREINMLSSSIQGFEISAITTLVDRIFSNNTIGDPDIVKRAFAELENVLTSL